ALAVFRLRCLKRSPKPLAMPGPASTTCRFSMSLPPLSMSAADEFRRAFFVEGIHAFAEIVGRAQAAVAMPLEIDGDGQAGIVGVVEQLLGGALGERRKGDQLFHQRIDSAFEFSVGDHLSGDAPVIGLLPGDALR